VKKFSHYLDIAQKLQVIAADEDDPELRTALERLVETYRTLAKKRARGLDQAKLGEARSDKD
jgi:hypothetical protein